MIEHNGKVLFSRTELRCRGSGLLILAPGFSDHLRELRIAFDRPMIVNSCCRSKNRNIQVKGHPRSLHVADYPHWPTKGACAIDIGRSVRFKDHEWLEYQSHLKAIAWALGWSIGDHPNFVHLDLRSLYIPKQFPQNKQIRFSY